MKVDFFKHENKYKNWKEDALENGVSGLSPSNSKLLLEYVQDMEQGLNVSKKSVKGARSYPRLNNIRQRLAQIMVMLQKKGIKDITKVKEKEIVTFFNDMRTGVIKKKDGGIYASVPDYTNVFCSFWHWYIKTNRKKGKAVIDITEDIDKRRDEQPAFVYITKPQLDEFLAYFSKEDQLKLLFVFDSLIRSPTELFSLKAGDIYEQNNKVFVHIAKEISKTKVFDRENELYLCGEEMLKYIKEKNLRPQEPLFNFNYLGFTQEMQRAAKTLFGNKMSHPKAKGMFGQITLYDLRHSGSIHLRQLIHKRPAFMSLDSLRQRGGWTDLKMLNYYTSFLGLTSEMNKGELLLEEDKTKMEKELETLKKNNQCFAESFLIMQHQIDKLSKGTKIKINRKEAEEELRPVLNALAKTKEK